MSNNTCIKFIAKFIDKTFFSFFHIILFITVIALFVPFSPNMPRDGLDPSWAIGLNQAIAQKLSFGKEIIFTFGPYAFIYTKLYHPNLDFLMLSVSLYLAIIFWTCLTILIKGAHWLWIFAVCATLVTLTYSRDALLFSIPLLIALVSYKTVWLKEKKQITKCLSPKFIAYIFSSLGLLPLIKGSLIILCGLIAIISSTYFAFKKYNCLAIISLLSPLASLLFFWAIVGQSIYDLLDYFKTMTSIISGYNEAMALHGKIANTILYLISSFYLLRTISKDAELSLDYKLFLLFTYVIFLFIAFKSGFVRDEPFNLDYPHYSLIATNTFSIENLLSLHEHTSAASLLFGAILLLFLFDKKTILSITLSAISWIFIDKLYTKKSIDRISNNIESLYFSSWRGIENRIKNKNWPRIQFDTAMDLLRQKASFPSLPGSTDIYSTNQAYLISSGNTWSPRPIFQSYSSYTPALIELNKKHLQGSQAPANIIFRVEPIDERLPSTEDGASWPILLNDYRPVSFEHGFLFLKKIKYNHSSMTEITVKTDKKRFGEEVILPPLEQVLFAKLEIHPSVFGRFANIFLKTSPLQIKINLDDGTHRVYRIVAAMAKSGFVISPLVENTAEFGMLYNQDRFLNSKRVKSMSIMELGPRTGLWKEEYSLTFSKVYFHKSNKLTEIYRFDRTEDKISDFETIISDKCTGSIDIINDMSTPIPFVTSTFLQVDGWLAVSTDPPVLPEAVYVVLTDAHGKHQYLRTRHTIRNDIGLIFKNHNLDKAGYSLLANVTKMKGKYTLGLAMKNLNKIVICPQFSLPVTFGKIDENR